MLRTFFVLSLLEEKSKGLWLLLFFFWWFVLPVVVREFGGVKLLVVKEEK